MTLNGHFALNSVLRRYVWGSEAWLSKLDYFKLVVNVVGENRKAASIARFPCDSTAFLYIRRTLSNCIENCTMYRLYTLFLVNK